MIDIKDIEIIDEVGNSLPVSSIYDLTYNNDGNFFPKSYYVGFGNGVCYHKISHLIEFDYFRYKKFYKLTWQ